MLLRVSRNKSRRETVLTGIEIRMARAQDARMRISESSGRQMEWESAGGGDRPSGVSIALAWLWRLVCIPVYAVLAVFRPLIGFILAVIGVLGVLVALFFRFVDPLPHFSFWTVLSISVGCLVMIGVYDIVVECFRPSWNR